MRKRVPVAEQEPSPGRRTRPEWAEPWRARPRAPRTTSLAKRLSPLQFDLQPVKYVLGQRGHRRAPVHGAALEAAKRHIFRPAEAFHQHALGAFDQFAVLQR